MAFNENFNVVTCGFIEFWFVLVIPVKFFQFGIFYCFLL